MQLKAGGCFVLPLLKDEPDKLSRSCPKMATVLQFPGWKQHGFFHDSPPLG